MKRRVITGISILFLLMGGFLYGEDLSEQDLENKEGFFCKMVTEKGEITFLLDFENTPLTVLNFARLAEGKIKTNRPDKYYNGLEFYKEIKNYAIFSGCSENRGDMGVQYTLPKEKSKIFSAANRGALVMDAVEGSSHGSRFFVMRAGDDYLNSKYTVFGQVVSGDSILNRLRATDKIISVEIMARGEKATSFYQTESQMKEILAEAQKKELENLRSSNPQLVAAVEALGADVQKSPEGIYFVTTLEGSGEKARPGNKLSIHYTGSLLDGTVFDSSIKRGKEFEIVLGEDAVISGWVLSLLDMKEGEVRQVVIPPNLGYGARSMGPIPANAWLVFEISLNKLKLTK